MTVAKNLYAAFGKVPVEDRVVVVECIRINGPMDTATIRHHMSAIDWTKERTDATVRWLRKHDVLYRATSNKKYSPIWGVKL